MQSFIWKVPVLQPVCRNSRHTASNTHSGTGWRCAFFKLGAPGIREDHLAGTPKPEEQCLGR